VDARASRAIFLLLVTTSICACGQRAVPAGRSSSPSETTPVFATALVADLRYQPYGPPAPDGLEVGCVGVATVWLDTTARGIYLTGPRGSS